MNNGERIAMLDRLILGENEYLEEGQVNELNMFTDLINDLSYDSLSIIQLVVQVEEAFDLEILDEDLDFAKLRKYEWWVELITKENVSGEE